MFDLQRKERSPRLCILLLLIYNYFSVYYRCGGGRNRLRRNPRGFLGEETRRKLKSQKMRIYAKIASSFCRKTANWKNALLSWKVVEKEKSTPSLLLYTRSTRTTFKRTESLGRLLVYPLPVALQVKLRKASLILKTKRTRMHTTKKLYRIAQIQCQVPSSSQKISWTLLKISVKKSVLFCVFFCKLDRAHIFLGATYS